METLTGMTMPSKACTSCAELWRLCRGRAVLTLCRGREDLEGLLRWLGRLQVGRYVVLDWWGVSVGLIGLFDVVGLLLWNRLHD